MGHESQIEPWSPLERRSALLVSELNRLRRPYAMTTATRETPNPNLPGPCPGAERMVWPVQTHRAQSTGPESKKNSGDGENFSLDFSFYRTGLSKAPIGHHCHPSTGAGGTSDKS